MAEQRCMSFEACRRRETMLGIIFIHTLDAVLICACDGTFMDANPSACAMLGYSRQEILSMHPWDIVEDVSRKKLLGQWQKLGQGVPEEKERSYCCKTRTVTVTERSIRLSSPKQDLIVLLINEKPQANSNGIGLMNAHLSATDYQGILQTMPSATIRNSFPNRQSGGHDGCNHEGASATKLRLLIADHQAIVREGLASMMASQADLSIVAEAGDGPETVALWKRHAPDVTLVDLHLPQLDGMGVIKQIRSLDPAARIIVLTSSDGAAAIYRAIQAGARAYILKDTCREELLTCIRNVHKGETYVTQSIAAKLAGYMVGEELTGREAEVLTSMAIGTSNKEIARRLFISQTTVKTHVRNIFGKLHVKSRTEAIAEAARRGLIDL